MLNIECEYTEGELLKISSVNRDNLKEFKNNLKNILNIHKFENARKETKKQQKKIEYMSIEKKLEENINNILHIDIDDNISTDFGDNKSNELDKSYSQSEENVFFKNENNYT